MSSLRPAWGWAFLILLLIPVIASAQFDENGNIIGSEHFPEAAPGDPCGSCPDPSQDIFGVTFKDGNLWVIDWMSGILYGLSSCSVVSTVPTGLSDPSGLGYDTLRGLFIVTDAANDLVIQLTPAGVVVNSWPAPGIGPVGAAYDRTRDLYWISDWEGDDIAAVNPNTGLTVMTFPAPAGTRIAGAGYDEGQDAILYNGRDEMWTYWMSATTGQLVANYPNPGGPGSNNGHGAAIGPDGNGWISHYEQPAIFCIGGFPVPTEAESWGSLKARFR